MHRVRFAILMLLASATVTFAQAEKTKKTDPSGTWRWTTDNNGAQQDHELRLRMDKKGNVRAIYNGMLDDVHSSAGIMKGDKLKLEFEVETPDGNEFEADYDVTVKGDTASGTLVLSSDEGNVDMPWEAKRTVKMSDVKGSWDLVLDIEGETREATLDIAGKAGKYKAFYTDKMVGKLEARDLKVTDNTLTFTVNGSHDGADFVAKCSGKPVGTSLVGESVIDLSGTTYEVPMKGMLQEADPIGTWNLSLQTDEGEMNPRLVINVKGGQLDGVFQAGDIGDFETKKITLDGEKIVYFMDGEVNGENGKAKVDAKISGDNFKGVLQLELGGQEMELPLAGKRMKKK